MNIALMRSMIDRYTATAFAHNYIFGFAFLGNIYTVCTDGSVLPYIMKLDRASRGQGMALRFKPDRNQKAFLLSMGAKVLCSVEYFESVFADCKYNRGEVFEKMVTESYGQEWVKDNVPYTMDGDITVKGIAYQIKFEKATFTNEKALASLA